MTLPDPYLPTAYKVRDDETTAPGFNTGENAMEMSDPLPQCSASLISPPQSPLPVYVGRCLDHFIPG
ncbi:hypothetical protein JZ751_023728 [Albula glossodonta]|uniref:Uncharacterized protein n=1 Tax=Albula glossodonta TaxID=121402 RepID=A0A8T2NHY8_9TELE|nr:hypothetical protein JZ751_023728 [Albula glossodonta]